MFSTRSSQIDDFLQTRRGLGDFDPVLEIRRIREELANILETPALDSAQAATQERAARLDATQNDWQSSDLSRYIAPSALATISPTSREQIAPLAAFSPHLDFSIPTKSAATKFSATSYIPVIPAAPRIAEIAARSVHVETGWEKRLLKTLRMKQNGITKSCRWEHTPRAARKKNTLPACAAISAHTKLQCRKHPPQENLQRPIQFLARLGLAGGIVGAILIFRGLQIESDFFWTLGLQISLIGTMLVVLRQLGDALVASHAAE